LGQPKLAWVATVLLWISRWTFGGVADKVVRHSIAPVMTIPPVGCRRGGYD